MKSSQLIQRIFLVVVAIFSAPVYAMDKLPGLEYLMFSLVGFSIIVPLLSLLFLLLITKKGSRWMFFWIFVTVTVFVILANKLFQYLFQHASLLPLLFLFLPIIPIYTHWYNDPPIKIVAFIVVYFALFGINPLAPFLLVAIVAVYIHWQGIGLLWFFLAATFVSLIIIPMIPYLYFLHLFISPEMTKNKENTQHPSVKHPIKITQVSNGYIQQNSQSDAKDRMGMTWGNYEHDSSLYIDTVGCHGQPLAPTNSGSCDVHKGDTSCQTALPVLCIKVDRSPRPNYAVVPQGGGVMPSEFYQGWAEGHIATTSPVVGKLELNTANAGDEICKKTFGNGWRMAEFHDGKYVPGMKLNYKYGSAANSISPWPTITSTGSWAFKAYGYVRNDTRYWVKINDKPANCWNSAETSRGNENTQIREENRTEILQVKNENNQQPTVEHPTQTTQVSQENTQQPKDPIRYIQQNTQPRAGERMGMTWGSGGHDSELDIDTVSCHGKPAAPSGGSCNAYQGDTSCQTALPVLCIKVDGSPRPNYAINPQSHGVMPPEFYQGWAEGHIAITPPVVGSLALNTEYSGDEVCKKSFGNGWRMAEFHDGKGGWAFKAHGNIRNDSRFWVKINDQRANCWNP